MLLVLQRKVLELHSHALGTAAQRHNLEPGRTYHAEVGSARF
jgi:hypothetical protein